MPPSPERKSLTILNFLYELAIDDATKNKNDKAIIITASIIRPPPQLVVVKIKYKPKTRNTSDTRPQKELTFLALLSHLCSHFVGGRSFTSQVNSILISFGFCSLSILQKVLVSQRCDFIIYQPSKTQ